MKRHSANVAKQVAAHLAKMPSDAGGPIDLLRSFFERRLRSPPGRAGMAHDQPKLVAFQVHLSPRQIEALAIVANVMGMGRSACVRALVSRWLEQRPSFNRADAMDLVRIVMELRRIGLCVSAAARDLTEAGRAGESLEVPLAELLRAHGETRAQIKALGQAFDANLSFWETRA